MIWVSIYLEKVWYFPMVSLGFKNVLEHVVIPMNTLDFKKMMKFSVTPHGFYHIQDICQVSGKTPKRTPVKVLLPHEVLDCLASCCPPHAFSSILLGNLDGPARRRFFEHIKTCDAWRDHPVLCQQGVDYESLIPITLHCDGAQFYRDDENFVWSFGSAFGSTGSIKDVLLTKFPIAIIPERFMQDHTVSGWIETTLFIFGCFSNKEFAFWGG